MRKFYDPVDGFTIQSDAMVLLQAIADATSGSEMPAVLDDLTPLPMSAIRAHGAFQYLKSKGLIEANFGIFYAARLSSLGHDALLAARTAQEPALSASPASEVFTLKPGIWGISVDLKEVVRWVRHCFRKV